MMTRETTTRAAACMAACLMTAWGAEEASAAVMFTGSITPDETITHAHIYYGNNTSTAAMRSLGTLPGGQTTNFTHTLDDDGSGVSSWTIDPGAYDDDWMLHPAYTIVGLIDAGGTPSVVVGMPDNSAILNGSTWSELFEADAPSGPMNFPEPDYINDLLSTPGSYTINESYFLDIADMLYWSRDFTGIDYGQPGTLVSFSTATFAGTMVVTPEPSAVTLLVAPVALALMRRRRPVERE